MKNDRWEGKMNKEEDTIYREMDKFILVFRIMKDLNVDIKEAQEMAESLIRRIEKVWNKEKIIMSEKEKYKFLYELIGAYGGLAEDFVERIK